MPLAISSIVEKVQHDFWLLITSYICHRMRTNLRPLFPLLDILLDIAPPADREPLRLGLFRVVVQHINMALKLTDGDQLLLPIAIHIHQPEPSIRPAVVITQLTL